MIYAWFKNILNGLRIRTFHGLKKWFFLRERVRGDSGDTLPLENYFKKITFSNIPKNASPGKHRYQSDPIHPDFFFDSCMKCNDAEQIVLNMHFFFTFSHWFASLPINSCLENLYRLGHGINSTGYELSKVVDMKDSTKHPPPFPPSCITLQI